MKKILSILKRIRLSSLLLLIVLLSFSSYAWMVFVTKVSTGLSAHVTAWDFDFKLGEDTVTTEIIFEVDQIYPGMDDFVQQVSVTNNGELNGEITYEIKKIEILGTTYETSTTVTSDDLLDMMETDFPFKLSVEVEGEDGNIIPIDETKNVSIKLVWPFESGNDELDTKWGQDAYEYYERSSENTCIHIELLLKVRQIAT